MISTATVFMGGIRPLPPDNQPTGIFKSEIVMPVWLGKEGLSGDAQAAQDRTYLMEYFGCSYGAGLFAAAHGIDERPIVTESEPKSVSRETTFECDLHPRQDRQQLGEVFTSLCQRVAGDLKRKVGLGRTVGIKLRYEDFYIVTRDHTLSESTDDPQTIRRAAGECLKHIPLDKRLGLLGVRLSTLTPIKDWKAEHPPSPQADLFFDTVSAP